MNCMRKKAICIYVGNRDISESLQRGKAFLFATYHILRPHDRKGNRRFSFRGILNARIPEQTIRTRRFLDVFFKCLEFQ